MRRGKGIICIMTLLLAAVILFLVIQDSAMEKTMDILLDYSVPAGSGRERLHAWKNTEGTYVVFLPGSAALDDVMLHPGQGVLTIGETEISEGTACGGFQLDLPYPITYRLDGTGVESSIIFVRSGGVPSLHIDVSSGSMEYIHMDKTHEEPGQLRLLGTDGAVLQTQTIEAVKGRGNTSWWAEKKPYNITLTQETDLLGMGAARNWVLLSEGYNSVNIRNKIVYDFAEKMGLLFSPGCEWVDLYLNGTYAGLYLLSEKNEVHSQRIDIAPEGSFLVSMEYESRLQEQQHPYVLTDASQALRVRYGAESLPQWQQLWQTVENAVQAEDGIDPVTGKSWQDLIDLDSWARKYLIEELFGNQDAGSLSQYYYRNGADPEGKIYAGPVWDYDFAMGGESVWLRDYTAYFCMNREQVNGEVFTPWFPALYRQDDFYQYIRQLYASQFLPGVEELIRETIPAYAEIIRDSVRMDQLRWGWELWNASEEADMIREFLRKRMDFLTDLWIEENPYHVVCVDPGRYGLYGYFAVKQGEHLPVLPDDKAVGGLGWYNTATGEPFDITQPIYEDASIYMKKPENPLSAIHYLPTAVLVPGLVLLLGTDRWRMKKKGRRRDEPVQTNEIPS